jgi:hypothetical protein
MRKDPTPQDAAALLQQDGRMPADYVLFRTDDEAPWFICVRQKDGGLQPLVVEDEDLADLCRMILLTEGAPRYTSAQALAEALERGELGFRS